MQKSEILYDCTGEGLRQSQKVCVVLKRKIFAAVCYSRAYAKWCDVRVNATNLLYSAFFIQLFPCLNALILLLLSLFLFIIFFKERKQERKA